MSKPILLALLLCAGLASAGPEAADELPPAVLPANRDAAKLPPPPVPWDANHAYTLPELVELALREHPETRITWEVARNAALATGVAESTYLPRITASIVGGHRYSESNRRIANLSLGGTDSVTGTVSAVSLLWLLYDFGQREAIVQSSRDLSSAAQMGFSGAHQKVIHEVCLTFYAYQAALRRYATAQLALTNADEIEAAAAARYKGEIGTLLEVMQARQGTAQARLTLVRSQGTKQNALAALMAAMGLPPVDGPQIAPLPQQSLDSTILPRVDGMLEEAIARRPDLQAAYAATRASRAAVTAAEANYRPKLFLSATGAYASGRFGLNAIPGVGNELPTLNIDASRWSSTLLLGVAIPIYDGHVRDNALQQARNNADKTGATLEKVRIEAIREVVVTRNNLGTSMAAYEVSHTLLETSQTLYDAALDAFRHGVGTFTATVAAQTQLAQARQTLDDAYFATRSAAVTLAFATGSLGSVPP